MVFTHEPGHAPPSSAGSVVWWVRTGTGWDHLNPTWTTTLEADIQAGRTTSVIFHPFGGGRRGTKYEFDFNAMLQRNPDSGTVRPILRTVVAPPPLGAGQGQAPIPAGAPAQASGKTPPQLPAQAGAAPPSAKPQGRAAQLPKDEEVKEWSGAASSTGAPPPQQGQRPGDDDEGDEAPGPATTTRQWLLERLGDDRNLPGRQR